MEINEDILIRYIDGMLTEEEAVEVKNWRAASLENEKLLEQVYFTAQVASRLKVMRTVNPDEALSRFKSRIHKKEKRLALRQVLGVIQRAAAVLFIPVFLLSAYLFIQQGQGNVRTLAVRTNPGVVSAFDLPDGSKVWLNAGSSLKYPTQFNDKQRVVSMQGEAYFEVAKDPSKPFQVEMNGASITVLGTHFNVKADAESDDITATLVEGSIRFEGAKQNIVMTPNQQLTFNRSTNKVDVKEIDTDTFTAWKDGLLKYKSIPFVELIKELQSAYKVEIQIDSQELKNPAVTVSGTFSQEQSIEQILKVISRSLPIRWHNSERVYYIQYATLKR